MSSDSCYLAPAVFDSPWGRFPWNILRTGPLNKWHQKRSKRDSPKNTCQRSNYIPLWQEVSLSPSHPSVEPSDFMSVVIPAKQTTLEHLQCKKEGGGGTSQRSGRPSRQIEKLSRTFIPCPTHPLLQSPTMILCFVSLWFWRWFFVHCRTPPAHHATPAAFSSWQPARHRTSRPAGHPGSGRPLC